MVRQAITVQSDESRKAESVNRVPQHIDSLILLAGSVGPRPLSACVGRSVLDLPVTSDRTVMQMWRSEASALSQNIEGASLSVRVVIDQSAHGLAGWRTTQPEASNRRWNDEPDNVRPDSIRYRVERDPVAYRGTAGVLRDLCSDSGSDDYVLVASAHQILLEPLASLVTELASRKADVVCLTHSDGTPAGLKLIRRSCLDLVPEVGFVDFKEQALPKISKHFSVEFVVKPEPVTLPLRTPAEYVLAARQVAARTAKTNPAAEVISSNNAAARRNVAQPVDLNAANHGSHFVLVEEGAKVHPRAILQDAIVLRGAKVHADAFVARSLVGPAGKVRRGRTLADGFVGAPTRSARGAQSARNARTS